MDLNKATLGVVGGGQLGRMMAYPAHRLGVKLVCLDAAGPTAPCAKISGHVVHGGLKDPEKTKELVAGPFIPSPLWTPCPTSSVQ